MVPTSKYKSWTTKYLQENVSVDIHDLGLGNCLSDMTPKPQTPKEKPNKLDYIKIKNISTTRNSIKKVKRKSTEQEKIL